MEWAYLFIPEARQDNKEAECEQNKRQYKSSFKNVHGDSRFVRIVGRWKGLNTKRVVQTHRCLHVLDNEKLYLKRDEIEFETDMLWRVYWRLKGVVFVN